MRSRKFDCVRAASGCQHGLAVLLEHHRNHVQDERFIVDNEDSWHRFSPLISKMRILALRFQNNVCIRPPGYVNCDVRYVPLPDLWANGSAIRTVVDFGAWIAVTAAAGNLSMGVLHVAIARAPGWRIARLFAAIAFTAAALQHF